VLEQLAKVVNAQARSAFAQARQRSGVLPNGRTVLGSVLDPFGVFKSSGLVTTDADDERVIKATADLAQILSKLSNQPGVALPTTLSQREFQQVANSVGRKVFERRDGLRATSSRFAAALLRQSLRRLDARDEGDRLTTTLVRRASEVSERAVKRFDP